MVSTRAAARALQAAAQQEDLVNPDRGLECIECQFKVLAALRKLRPRDTRDLGRLRIRRESVDAFLERRDLIAERMELGQCSPAFC